MSAKRPHYVNQKKLYTQTVISQALGRKTPELIKMLIKINDGVNSKFNYYGGDDDRYDCKMEALAVLLSNWHTFDSENYASPFQLFTEISKRGHTKGLDLIYGQKGLKKDERKKIYSIDLLFGGDDNNGGSMKNML